MDSDLARAMAALIFARVAGDLDRDALTERLARVVRSFDDADSEYGAAIKRTLSREHAGEMLEAMESFRTEVRQIRTQIRAAAPYGDFDPLDTYVPPFTGSHGDAIRAANLGDRARQAVREARASVNAQIVALLSQEELERLVEAKRRREAAFERALREALPATVSDRLAADLLQLAENWY